MAGYRDELERLNFSAEEKEALTWSGGAGRKRSAHASPIAGWWPS